MMSSLKLIAVLGHSYRNDNSTDRPLRHAYCVSKRCGNKHYVRRSNHCVRSNSWTHVLEVKGQILKIRAFCNKSLLLSNCSFCRNGVDASKSRSTIIRSPLCKFSSFFNRLNALPNEIPNCDNKVLQQQPQHPETTKM